MLLSHAAAADTSYGELIGDRAPVFAENTRLFETPSESSTVVCTLPVGTEVFRLAAVDIQHTSDGLSSTWMQGACTLGGETFQGYIPMSWLAMTHQELGADTLLLFGIASGNPLTGRFAGVAKVVSDGRMLWGAAFFPPSTDMGGSDYRYGVSSRRLDPAGLPGIEDLLMLSFLYEACGFENRDVLLAWTGRYLVAGPSASRMSEAGVFHYAEDMLLPADDPLLGSDILVISTSEEWDEATEGYRTVAVDTTRWWWTGIDFEEMPR